MQPDLIRGDAIGRYVGAVVGSCFILKSARISSTICASLFRDGVNSGGFNSQDPEWGGVERWNVCEYSWRVPPFDWNHCSM
jgi:hypothetical protein